MSKARKTAASSGEPDFWRVARDWLHHWLPKVRGSSPKTVEAYRIGLESYVRWLETTEGTQRSHIGFGHFDRARLGRWVEWMRTERGYSDRTIMLRMTTMRVFLDHAGLEHPALTALGNDAAAYVSNHPRANRRPPRGGAHQSVADRMGHRRRQIAQEPHAPDPHVRHRRQDRRTRRTDHRGRGYG